MSLHFIDHDEKIFADNEIYVSCSDEELEYYCNFSTSRIARCKYLSKEGFNFKILGDELKAFHVKNGFLTSWMIETNKDYKYAPYISDNIHISVSTNNNELNMSFYYEDNGLDICDIKELAKSNGYKVLIDSELNERLIDYDLRYNAKKNKVEKIDELRNALFKNGIKTIEDFCNEKIQEKSCSMGEIHYLINNAMIHMSDERFDEYYKEYINCQ